MVSTRNYWESSAKQCLSSKTSHKILGTGGTSTNQPEIAKRGQRPLDCLYIYPLQGLVPLVSQLGRKALYGLYDNDGILRCTGGDREACLAYAELFEMKKVECSVLVLPDSANSGSRSKETPHQAKNSN